MCRVVFGSEGTLILWEKRDNEQNESTIVCLEVIRRIKERRKVMLEKRADSAGGWGGEGLVLNKVARKSFT